MKSFLQNNVIEMYSAHNEEPYIIKFIITWQNTVSKYVYIDKQDDIVNTDNNTYHSKIKVKTVDEKSNTYIDSSKEAINKNSEFKIYDIVRM